MPAGLRALRHEVRSLAGLSPALFLPLIRRRGRRAGLAVGPDTELVVEGFPRSGNTFAVAAFRLAQPRPVCIAHHLHVPAQVLWAVRRGVPTLVLVREPAGAIVSWVIREPGIPLSAALRAYNRFHAWILPHARGFAVATFDEVVGDFGAVVRRVNRRFGTAFAEFRHDEPGLADVFREIERMDQKDTGASTVTETTVARPSEAREGPKAAQRARLEADARLARPLERARRLYAEFVRLAGAAGG